jgi:elongation factor P
MINSQDVKNGMCIKLDGRFYFVIEFLHVKPGKGNTIMRTKLKDVVDGRVIDRTFQVGFKLEDVRIERRPYQFLYKEGDSYIFMNQETYDQIPIEASKVTGVAFLKEGNSVDVVSDASTETILFAELPVKVVLKIAYTEPGLKGDTATNATKPAKLETGAEIRIPLFINEGELVEVDTRDGSYVGRVKA